MIELLHAAEMVVDGGGADASLLADFLAGGAQVPFGRKNFTSGLDDFFLRAENALPAGGGPWLGRGFFMD